MSDYEYNVGKLIPCEWKGTIEETCKAILIEIGTSEFEEIAIGSTGDSYRERLDDDGYREYFITDNMVYKAEYEKKDASADIFKATKNEDGTINFETKFYNGGCSFNEALEEALKKIT